MVTEDLIAAGAVVLVSAFATASDKPSSDFAMYMMLLVCAKTNIRLTRPHLLHCSVS